VVACPTASQNPEPWILGALNGPAGSARRHKNTSTEASLLPVAPAKGYVIQIM
jgi:hypothetical protein